MIMKPNRINVRFSDVEFTELKALFYIAGVHDWTSFTRKAFAEYRRYLLAGREDKPPYTLKPPVRQTMPALSDKDNRDKPKPAAAKTPTKKKFLSKGPKRHTV